MMIDAGKIKKEFNEAKERLFQDQQLQKEGYNLSREYSLLVEEYIVKILGAQPQGFAIASSGSFSRRELSPFSDIDLMIIVRVFEDHEDDIKKIVRVLWDCGIEVSHTIRDFNDIERFLVEDLHSFTQFFETRYLLGSGSLYKEWNEKVFSLIDDDVIVKLLKDYFDDIQCRYEKFGDSPKVLEPNVKHTAGGLRDLQAVEWMFILKNKIFLNKQSEITQAENFFKILEESNFTTPNECLRLNKSYNLLLTVRNLLHITSKQKTDRFEFNSQIKVAGVFGYTKDNFNIFMKEYFEATTIINRFCKTMVKRFNEEISNPIPDALFIDLDDDFKIKNKVISFCGDSPLTLSTILRAFYYRGLHSASFDENLRSLIIQNIEKYKNSSLDEMESSVFFREILKLPKNVGQTLSVMNELCVLGTFLPEFKDLEGFLQHGVYHCYTADEHTLMAIQNLERLENQTSHIALLFNTLKSKEILFLSLLFHDIAKPINISGHEIIGAEMASSIAQRLGYSDAEIEQVRFLVLNHLLMEQVAFRRNLNDPETLNNFTGKFSSTDDLDLLYLLTYADLSAVNSAVWTSWKAELLHELYSKSKSMLEERITGEELLISSIEIIPREIIKYSDEISERSVREHIESMTDLTYAQQFTDEEIARHVEEIEKGERVSVIFKDLSDFTNITVITQDSPSLLSKICGVLSINDANIHDAKIFTRRDGIVIDTFNVTDFRSGKTLDSEKFPKIEEDLKQVIEGILQLGLEFKKLKNRWWRIENKFFKRTGKVKIAFEEHEKYTIIDIFSPDRLGFLYLITSKMSELGLYIYFAKIATKGDDIVDAFYILDRNGNKVSEIDKELIIQELTESISQML
jgi:[protein-PII] uridylyltransferase